MKKLVIYLDAQKKHKHVITPTADFIGYDKGKGKSTYSHWAELARDLYPTHYCFVIVGNE